MGDSTGGGLEPVWSRRPGELYYLYRTRRVMAAPYPVKADAFVPGNPRVWTEAPVSPVLGARNYDAGPDGKSIVVLVAGETAGQKTSTQVTLLVNFFDELRRRAP